MILIDLAITLLARFIATPIIIAEHILHAPKQQPRPPTRRAECWEPGETRPCTGCPAGVCRWFPDMAVNK